MNTPHLKTTGHRPATHRRVLPCLTLLFVLPSLSHAQIYSCPAADGGVSYQQTPCPEAAPEPPAAALDDSEAEPANASLNSDCEAAGRLAFATARLMHGGLGIDETLGELGGAALPAEPRQLIDSVYSFHGDAELSAERIGAISETLCRGGSFGEFSCDALPGGNARRAAGCSIEARASSPLISERRPAPVKLPDTLSAADRQAVRRCREPIEARIEAIDVELRRGVRGETAQRHLQELLALTDALRACVP